MRNYHLQLRKSTHASLQALADEWGVAKSIEVRNHSQWQLAMLCDI